MKANIIIMTYLLVVISLSLGAQESKNESQSPSLYFADLLSSDVLNTDLKKRLGQMEERCLRPEYYQGRNICNFKDGITSPKKDKDYNTFHKKNFKKGGGLLLNTEVGSYVAIPTAISNSMIKVSEYLPFHTERSRLVYQAILRALTEITESYPKTFKRDCVKAALAACVTSNMTSFNMLTLKLFKDPLRIIESGQGQCIDFSTLLLNFSQHLGVKAHRANMMSSPYAAASLGNSAAKVQMANQGTCSLGITQPHTSVLSMIGAVTAGVVAYGLMGNHQFVLFDFSKDNLKKPYWSYEPIYGTYYGRSFGMYKNLRHPQSGFLFYDANEYSHPFLKKKKKGKK